MSRWEVNLPVSIRVDFSFAEWSLVAGLMVVARLSGLPSTVTALVSAHSQKKKPKHERTRARPRERRNDKGEQDYEQIRRNSWKNRRTLLCGSLAAGRGR